MADEKWCVDWREGAHSISTSKSDQCLLLVCHDNNATERTVFGTFIPIRYIRYRLRGRRVFLALHDAHMSTYGWLDLKPFSITVPPRMCGCPPLRTLDVAWLQSLLMLAPFLSTWSTSTDTHNEPQLTTWRVKEKHRSNTPHAPWVSGLTGSTGVDSSTVFRQTVTSTQGG